MSDISKTKKITKKPRNITIKRKVNDDTQNEKYDKQLEKKFKRLDKKGFNESKVAEYDNYKEKLNRSVIANNHNKYPYLYPDLDDPNFNVKIAERKEFNDTKYDGKIRPIIEDANKLCNAEFELSPHQLFVKNFLSFQTPYNSLLLYHGLGSGKTCSAIGVAEEMRDYLKQIGNSQRIIVVASPNVQTNFKIQLFDDRKLKEIDGIWNIRSCTGTKYLKEINPMIMKGLPKETVIRQVKRLIDSSYVFMGYIEFANHILNKSRVDDPELSEEKRQRIMKRKLVKHFSSRLVIIDEVHNIRITQDNKDKRVANELFKLAKSFFSKFVITTFK